MELRASSMSIVIASTQTQRTRYVDIATGNMVYPCKNYIDWWYMNRMMHIIFPRETDALGDLSRKVFVVEVAASARIITTATLEAILSQTQYV